MFSRKTSLNVQLVVTILGLFAETIQAKSVYVINNTNTSQLQAYKVEDENLTYQTDYDCISSSGAVGIAIDKSAYGDFLFVTFESSPAKIEIINAKTMQYVDAVTTTGTSNLAGIVVDKGKRKVYAVDRDHYYGSLFVYFWEAQTKTLTPALPSPYYVQLPDCSTGYGIALDEENGLLYVADNTKKIKYYNTTDWSKVGEVNVTCNVISVALDVSRQLLYYGSMGDYGQGNPNLYQYDISAQNENTVTVGCSIAGISIDQTTGLVYLTTYGGGGDTNYPDPPNDRLMVYNASLNQLWYSGDIGNPAGVAVGTTATYKPPLFYLEKVDVNEPNCASFDDYITYRIIYGPNSYDHNNVVLTDYLPLEVDYVSSSPDGNYNNVLRTVSWNIGPLDANTPNGFVTLTVKVDKCAESDGIITNYCVIESDIAYSDAEYATYLCSASNPKPACGEIVDLDTGEFNLTWCPGHFAADVNGHEVYFGTNFNDVNDANISDPNAYKGKVNNPSYPIKFGDLDVDTTYYWRIDEVNTAHPDLRWRGGVWSFTTGSYKVVDNFESYADDAALRAVWKKLSTKAIVSLETDPTLVRNGSKSMQYHYSNSYSPYYSEACVDTTGPNSLPSLIRSDWSDAKLLRLYFFGKVDNDPNEQMYVKLTDGSAHTAKVIYDGDADDVQEEAWHQWNIPLTTFTDMNLADVKKIAIGFGDGVQSPAWSSYVWFDDIRLYLAGRCIPGYYPAGDFDSDCNVDFYDFAIFALAWLTSPGQPNYNLLCDISVPGGDEKINEDDLARFCDDWLWQESKETR